MHKTQQKREKERERERERDALIKTSRSKQRHTRQLFLKISGYSLPISPRFIRTANHRANPLSVNKTIHETPIPVADISTVVGNKRERDFPEISCGRWATVCRSLASERERSRPCDLRVAATAFRGCFFFRRNVRKKKEKKGKSRRVTQVPCPCFVTHSSSASMQHVHPAYRHMRSRWPRRRRRCECAAYPDPCPSLFDKGDKTSRAFGRPLPGGCTNTAAREGNPRARRDETRRDETREPQRYARRSTEPRDTAGGTVSVGKAEESRGVEHEDARSFGQSAWRGIASRRVAFFVACPAEFFVGPTLCGPRTQYFCPARTSLSLSRNAPVCGSACT